MKKKNVNKLLALGLVSAMTAGMLAGCGNTASTTTDNGAADGQFDFAREGWLADYNDPINMLEMWETTSGNNDMQFGR